jgi:hypothetical protein
MQLTAVLKVTEFAKAIYRGEGMLSRTIVSSMLDSQRAELHAYSRSSKVAYTAKYHL